MHLASAIANCRSMRFEMSVDSFHERLNFSWMASYAASFSARRALVSGFEEIDERSDGFGGLGTANYPGGDTGSADFPNGHDSLPL